MRTSTPQDQREFVMLLAAFGTVPPLLLYGAGLLVRWLRAGFAKR